jgi:seryl-tRNA synthetase
MLDPRAVSENPEAVRAHLVRRNADESTLAMPARIAELTARRASLLQESENCRAQRNKLSPQIGQMMKAGKRDEAEELKVRVRGLSARAKEIEGEVRSVEEERHDLLMQMPNLLADEVPDGRNEHDNVTVRTWGTPRELDFQPKDHDELAEALGILDTASSARMSGARFAVLRGLGARLDRALTNLFLDLHTSEHGYLEVEVPYLVWRTTMEGTGQLPKFEEDLFKLSEPLNGQDAFLIPTAEVPVTNLHRESILDESQLPISYVCFTPCFRAEAGSYGKDTRGLIRQHQFNKVEMVKITTPEQGRAEHLALTAHAEACLQALELPYRVQRLCAGDISANARLCYDLEVWLPGQQAYREISSCSWFSDFQSRRMDLRYRPAPEPSKKKGGRPRYCHTVNGSGLAIGRALVAVLENGQQADGSIVLPQALHAYMGGLDRITVQE